MGEEKEIRKSRSEVRSSKELLYSDYTDTTVVEHVLKSLEKSTHMTRSEEINKFLKTKDEKSAFERAKKLICMMDKDKTGTCLEASGDDEEAIDVQLTIGDCNFDFDTESYKADAWFMLPRSKIQVSEYSDEEPDENSSTSSPKKDLLSFEEDSSDLSDNESLKDFSVSTGKKNFLEVIEEDCSESDDEDK